MFFEKVRQLWFRLTFPKLPKTIGHAIRLIPIEENPAPDRHFQEWLNDPHPMLGYDLPPVELKIVNLGNRTIDELVELFDPEECVIHTGHEAEECTGKSAHEGLADILRDEPSSWEIRMAKANIGYDVVKHHRSLFEVLRRRPRVTYEPAIDRLASIEIFMAQEFQGNEPGRPNRDICTFYIGREADGVKLQLKIPYRHVASDGYLRVGYLRVDAEIDATKGIVIRNHEED